ncbi:MAG: metal ABC transporter permease [Candidatus Methanofastidiosia archaeon]
MIEILHYEFMQNAFAAGILASVICGVVGVYVVLKRLVFISGGIAHFSFCGIGFGYYSGINPTLSTIVFSLLAASAIGGAKHKAKLQEDTTIGILWATGMALGIIFIGLSSEYAIDLFSYLFGNILAVSHQDLIIMAILSGIIIIIVALFYKEFLALSFDEEYSTVMGLPVQALYILLLCLIALTIVVLIKIVGVILVIALLTIPATTSRLFSHSVKKMMIISILFGAIYTSLGLTISYYLGFASGATIVLVSGSIFFIILVLRNIFHSK